MALRLPGPIRMLCNRGNAAAVVSCAVFAVDVDSVAKGRVGSVKLSANEIEDQHNIPRPNTAITLRLATNKLLTIAQRIQHQFDSPLWIFAHDVLNRIPVKMLG